MTAPLVLLGAGDHAREIVDLVAACVADGTSDHELVGYLVEPGFGEVGDRVDDLPILGDLSWLSGRGGSVHVVCAVGSSPLRWRLSRSAAAYGAPFATLVHPGVQHGSRIEIGEGVVIAAGCVLTQRIRIGDHTHLNVGCTVSHGVQIADHVTLSPGVHLAGNVAVGRGAFVGLGANVVPGRRLGDWSTIGAGCTVIRDVEANDTVVGVPGRVIETRAAGWHEMNHAGSD